MNKEISAGKVPCGTTVYTVTNAHDHKTLKEGDIVRMTENLRLIREDFTLHRLTDDNGQYVHLMEVPIGGATAPLPVKVPVTPRREASCYPTPCDLTGDLAWAKFRERLDFSRYRERLIAHFVNTRDTRAMTLLFDWEGATINALGLMAVQTEYLRRDNRLKHATECYKCGHYEAAADAFYDLLCAAMIIDTAGDEVQNG